jgi:uncharacterized delta-60 repeat protein
MKTTYVLAVAALAVLAGASLVAASPASFGPRSTEKASETPQVSIDLARSLAVAPDGKLVVAGLSRKGGRYVWAVARYSSNGRLDRSFGSGGRVLTEFGSGTVNAADAVAAQPDGKVIVAGSGEVARRGHTGFALARYSVHGRLDPSFGRGGHVVTAFNVLPGEQFSVTAASAVAIETDGKLVVAGGRGGVDSRDFALARYTARGKLDPSFGRGGKVVTALGSSHQAQPAAVAIQPDGKIVAAGWILTRGRQPSSEFVVARFTVRGKLDPSFGRGGSVATGFRLGGEASGVAVQADGKLVVAGSVNTDSFGVVRYTADGKLDPSFGAGGKVITDVASGGAIAHVSGLALQPDRKLVVSGNAEGSITLIRYTAGGDLDSSFGRGGVVITDLGPGRQAQAQAVAIQRDGKIVAAGSSSGDFALVRYTDGGSLDSSFGAGGTTTTPFGDVWRTRLASFFVTRSKGRIVVRWRTASEFDAQGFNVYRGQDGTRRRANPLLIQAKAGFGPSATYAFVDRGALGSTRRYWLQEVTVDRTLRWLGQVRVRR